MTNALLSDWTSEFEMPPFAEITDEDFGSAFDTALLEARGKIAKIAENPEAPSFQNTIEAMELADGLLDKVAGVFYNLASADSNPAREALMRELAPKMSAYSSEIMMNEVLFQRVRTLWEAREGLDLGAEQARVLELYHRMFVRSGSAVEGDDRERLKNVKSRLAVLGTQFTQNLLAD